MKLDDKMRDSFLAHRMRGLLRKEKARRGVNQERLVFIGVRDVARYYWGIEKSFLQNRRMEFNYFSAYLKDRISYARRLGYIEELPRLDYDILRVGEEITLSDINKLLKENQLNQNDDTPFLSRAEQYPTLRWNFEWNNYVVVGAPDGITDRFVYQFQTIKNRKLMSFAKPVALTQADLYGYFFQREDKRVQIYITEEQLTETWQEKVDKDRAEKALKYYDGNHK